MTAPVSDQPVAAGQLARLWAFAVSPAARPARLGFLGAVLIARAGWGAGSTRLHDPLLNRCTVLAAFGHGLVCPRCCWGRASR
jgi:alpha-1,6-mannosyltransferase